MQEVGECGSFTIFYFIISPIHYSCKILMRSADFQIDESEKEEFFSHSGLQR